MHSVYDLMADHLILDNLLFNIIICSSLYLEALIIKIYAFYWSKGLDNYSALAE